MKVAALGITGLKESITSINQEQMHRVNVGFQLIVLSIG